MNPITVLRDIEIPCVAISANFTSWYYSKYFILKKKYFKEHKVTAVAFTFYFLSFWVNYICQCLPKIVFLDLLELQNM